MPRKDILVAGIHGETEERKFFVPAVLLVEQADFYFRPEHIRLVLAKPFFFENQVAELVACAWPFPECGPQPIRDIVGLLCLFRNSPVTFAVIDIRFLCLLYPHVFFSPSDLSISGPNLPNPFSESRYSLSACASPVFSGFLYVDCEPLLFSLLFPFSLTHAFFVLFLLHSF